MTDESFCHIHITASTSKKDLIFLFYGNSVDSLLNQHSTVSSHCWDTKYSITSPLTAPGWDVLSVPHEHASSVIMKICVLLCVLGSHKYIRVLICFSLSSKSLSVESWAVMTLYNEDSVVITAGTRTILTQVLCWSRWIQHLCHGFMISGYGYTTS